MKDKNFYNELKGKREWLIRQFNDLLREYRELQDYFKRTKSPKDAEYFFHQIKLGEWCQFWNEWEFGRGHRTLKERMSENRKDRNKITDDIRLVKHLMKTYTKEVNI